MLVMTRSAMLRMSWLESLRSRWNELIASSASSLHSSLASAWWTRYMYTIFLISTDFICGAARQRGPVAR